MGEISLSAGFLSEAYSTAHTKGPHRQTTNSLRLRVVTIERVVFPMAATIPTMTNASPDGGHTLKTARRSGSPNEMAA